MLIARLVNHRNPHIAMLTLALLDTLVQSCGYPFHLQIATKEFLNELVRRFPERPPPFPGPVMSRILELIHTWKEGICTDSRWKDDLGNIRDMHRLLTFKGYRFRDMPRGNRNETAVATSVRVYLSSVYPIILAERHGVYMASRFTGWRTAGACMLCPIAFVFTASAGCHISRLFRPSFGRKAVTVVIQLFFGPQDSN